MRIYIDTSVIGGCSDEEFAEWSLRLMQEFRDGLKVAVISDITLQELELAPEIVRLQLDVTERKATKNLELLCAEPREYSDSLTAVLVPEGYDADRVREIILDGFDMSLGTGLGKMRGKIFRIGHLGHFNDLMLCGTLCGVEMGLHRAGIPHKKGGVAAALDYLGALDGGS